MPEPLVTRGYTDADAAAVIDLSNLIDVHAGGHPGGTIEDVRTMMATVVPDPEQDCRLVFAGDQLVAFGTLIPPPPDGFRVDLIGGVHPRWRGRGVGRDLLSWQLERTAWWHGERAPHQSWRVQAGCIVGDADAPRLFTRFGLAPIRYWSDMVAQTAQAGAVPVPEGLTLIGYDPAREKELYAAHTDAFADHWGYQMRTYEVWSELTVRSPGFLPGHSRFALAGDEIAGYLLSFEDPDPDRLYIGHVGVRRPWRRRGLAGALLAEVLGSAHRGGFGRAYLGVDADSPTGAVGVYERAGFVVEHRSVSYALSLDADPEPA